ETSKEIEIPIHDDPYLEPNETFQVYFTVVMGGSPGTPGTATVTIIDDDPNGSPPPAKALNISTRAPVQTGERILIGGFIVTGNDNKHVIIRGLGPSLGQNGIPSNQALQDPVLQLNAADGSVLGVNDNWRDDIATRFQIEGTIYEPKDERESVILAVLEPGAYTVFVTGRNQTQGIGLVEVYDPNGAADAELRNVSTRGQVGQENDVMIAGFILGNENGSVQVAVRGLGPSLSKFGLSHVLPDPALEVHNADGTGFASNDDWESDAVAATQLTAHGLALSDPKESGLFLVLPPGQYTAILHGKNIGAGLGLVEVFNLK
ncbi:MAG TPA: hypothetical protein VJS88_06535, partial [Chthoniobacterales bacterium]|nr:hypothetical protein [Chthoniobacterales bacterium]